MKLKSLLLLAICHISVASYGQKKLITNETYKNWKTLGPYGISSDGKYVWYHIYDYISSGLSVTLNVSTAEGRLISTFKNVSSQLPVFTDDGRRLIFSTNKDSVVILDLKSQSIRLILSSGTFKLIRINRSPFLITGYGKTLSVTNINTDSQIKYEDVDEYLINKQETRMVLKNENGLKWVNVRDGKVAEIFQGASANVVFDNSGKQVVFINKKKDNDISIFYFKDGTVKARLFLDNYIPGVPSGYKLSSSDLRFSPDGKHLFFKVAPIARERVKDPDIIFDQLDIWSYSQQFLMPYQLEKKDDCLNRNLLAVAPIGSEIFVNLIESNTTESCSFAGNNYVLIRTLTNPWEDAINVKQLAVYELISINDGKHISLPLPRSYRKSRHVSLSPGERFITWWDSETSDIISYEIATGICRNLTEKLNIPFDWKRGSIPQRLEPLFKWLPNDEALFIRDKYDIWQIDPTGKTNGINITHAFGRINKVGFLITNRESVVDPSSVLVTGLDSLINNGIIALNLHRPEEFVIPSFDPCLYFWPSSLLGDKVSGDIIKAKNANMYILERQTAETAPNLVITSDFKKYRLLSNIHPEKEYNWLTSELVSWTMYNGQKGNAILYKPENFDSTKSYPVIFTYYQKRSPGLHKYLDPTSSIGMQIDISWFASNGYLVCMPDIENNRTGEIGKTVVNSVESAARYLSKFPWVNSKKLGLNGHSLGGYETNLLITKSNLFAAAQSSNGMSDVVSYVGSTSFGGVGMYSVTEDGFGQMGVGVTPWSHPEIYLENSPVFGIDKINTPLLMRHGKADGQVPVSQSIEFFIGMKRAGKKVWLLEYNLGHTLEAGDDATLDFNIRQQQFFDYYLKDKPAPLWMVDGVPALDKGIKSGLQIDSLNRTP